MGAVNVLKTKFPDYDIILTGHSLGAAVATLSAVDLIKNGTSVSLYTFGSPRVGNKEFADYVRSLYSKLPDKFNSYRFTHYRDVIVHVPYASMGYEHVDTEVYEDAAHHLTVCTAVEDHACSQQWGFIECDIQDHLLYLNLYMDCSRV
jgi:predicted lipase